MDLLEILTVIGIAIVGLVLIHTIKPLRPDVAMILSLAISIYILFLVLGRVSAVIETIAGIAGRAGVSNLYLNTVIKVIGVSYITGFTADLCRDSGEGALATKVELAGKAIIIAMAVPIMMAILDTISGIIS